MTSNEKGLSSDLRKNRRKMPPADMQHVTTQSVPETALSGKCCKQWHGLLRLKSANGHDVTKQALIEVTSIVSERNYDI